VSREIAQELMELISPYICDIKEQFNATISIFNVTLHCFPSLDVYGILNKKVIIEMED
jgi:hypothetical protein